MGFLIKMYFKDQQYYSSDLDTCYDQIHRLKEFRGLTQAEKRRHSDLYEKIVYGDIPTTTVVEISLDDLYWMSIEGNTLRMEYKGS